MMNDDDPFLSEDEKALHARLTELRLEHSDLDASIEALLRLPQPDQLMVARLKFSASAPTSRGAGYHRLISAALLAHPHGGVGLGEPDLGVGVAGEGADAE